MLKFTVFILFVIIQSSQEHLIQPQYLPSRHLLPLSHPSRHVRSLEQPNRHARSVEVTGDEIDPSGEVEITLDNVDEDLFTVEDSGDLESQETQEESERKMRRINELLKMIESQASKGENCTPGTELDLGEEVVDSYGQERFQAAALISVNRANWLTRMWKYGRSAVEGSEFLLDSALIEMMEYNEDIFAAGNCYDKEQYGNYFLFCPYAYRLPNSSVLAKDLALEYNYLSNSSVWFYDARQKAQQIIRENIQIKKGFHAVNVNLSNTILEEKEILVVRYRDGQWTKPYYDCGGGNIWMMTYTVPFFGYDSAREQYYFKGTSGIDIDLRRVDINQCHNNGSSFNVFGGTDKCKKETTMCQPLSGLGFRRGSYICTCKVGYYYPEVSSAFKYYNGTILEEEYEKKLMGANMTYYDQLSTFQCLQCAEGCDECTDSSPCIVTLNMVLRTILLVLQCVIIGCLPVVVLFTYKYSELKVVKAASPVLLRIIILGAFFIYSTTIVLYPRPNMLTCTLRIWLREIGFALSYGALMLKTWRISVIFRVRSAKAVKITDMDLIKRLGIIVGIFVLLLLIRTLVSPPKVIIGRTADDLKAFLCESDWWDHSFTILEFLFLLWGIRLCIRVRKAPSEFNESRFISMTIYNEFLLSIFLNVSMFFLQHPANPDLLYIIFFCHCQLTITILLCLIFASKFYLVMKGQGKDIQEEPANKKKQQVGNYNKPAPPTRELPSLSTVNDPLSSEAAILAELNNISKTLLQLQEKNALNGSVAVSKKILAIQEAITSSPNHNRNNSSTKVSQSTPPPTSVASKSAVSASAGVTSNEASSCDAPLTPVTSQTPSPAQVTAIAASSQEQPNKDVEEKTGKLNKLSSNNHEVSTTHNKIKEPVEHVKTLQDYRKTGIDNMLMNGDIYHPDEIIANAIRQSPVNHQKGTNNNNHINHTKVENASIIQDGGKCKQGSVHETGSPDVNKVFSPDNTIISSHDLLNSEPEYIDYHSDADETTKLCAEHKAMATSGNHVSSHVRGIQNGRHCPMQEEYTNGHSIQPSNGENSRREKRSNSNRKTPIRQRLIINLDDKNKFTEEVTV